MRRLNLSLEGLRLPVTASISTQSVRSACRLSRSAEYLRHGSRWCRHPCQCATLTSRPAGLDSWPTPLAPTNRQSAACPPWLAIGGSSARRQFWSLCAQQPVALGTVGTALGNSAISTRGTCLTVPASSRGIKRSNQKAGR